jgi:hypothetical protein
VRAGVSPAGAALDPLSPATLAQLRHVAARHPSAALALFQVLQDRGGIQNTGMFLTFIPTTQMALEAFENLDEQKAVELSMFLRQNFYDQAEPVVYISWSVARAARKDAGPDQQVVTFRAELVKDGAPIEPHHLIEADVIVVLNGSEIRVLDPSGQQTRLAL